MKAYEYEHVVGFEETNLLGNVYYTNLLLWQGRCREMFLKEHVPEILSDLNQVLSLSTMHCSCDFLDELWAFDRIVIRMRLKEMVQNRIKLAFEYWRGEVSEEARVARGSQEIACMQRDRDRLEPVPIPSNLREALEQYA